LFKGFNVTSRMGPSVWHRNKNFKL